VIINKLRRYFFFCDRLTLEILQIMKLVRTIKLVLNPTEEQKQVLPETLVIAT